MKQIIFSIFLILAVLKVNSQNTIQYGKTIIGKQKPGFYKTQEDLLNDKIEYLGELDEKIVVDYFVKLGGKVYKFSEVNYYGFKDAFGNRFRIINGKAYNMLCYGKLCLYIKGYRLNVIDNKTKAIERGAPNQDFTFVYYSEGPSGNLIQIKNYDKPSSVADALFKDDEIIKNEYLNDKNDDLDPTCKRCITDDLERIIFYSNKYNEKHK